MENHRLRVDESTRSTVVDRNQRNAAVSVAGDRFEVEEELQEKVEEEEEVKEMAEKVKKYRSNLPAHLNSTLSSFLVSQRPLFSLSSDIGGSHPGAGFSLCNSNVALLAHDDKSVDDVQLLREKISSNISAMPIILKRMNDCISRFDKLVSSNEAIHPAFKRNKS